MIRSDHFMVFVSSSSLIHLHFICSPLISYCLHVPKKLFYGVYVKLVVGGGLEIDYNRCSPFRDCILVEDYSRRSPSPPPPGKFGPDSTFDCVSVFWLLLVLALIMINYY